MRKRFILLIDFSEYSSNLIKYACNWSKQTNAELLLVHQTIVLSPALTDDKSKQEITQYANNEARQKLKALAKTLIPNTIKVSYSVSESHLHLTIDKLLTEPFENLIFVGVKGTGLLKKIFLGSVALDIIDNTKNIIVAMPKEIDVFSHEKIFVAVSEKNRLNVEGLSNFLKFIDNKNTNITFFYLAKPNEETRGMEKQLQKLSEMYADRFNTNFAIYEGKDPYNDIKKVINSNIDEILIIQKGSSFMTDLFFKRFVINKLVYEGQTPLIVLP